MGISTQPSRLLFALDKDPGYQNSKVAGIYILITFVLFGFVVDIILANSGYL